MMLFALKVLSKSLSFLNITYDICYFWTSIAFTFQTGLELFKSSPSFCSKVVSLLKCDKPDNIIMRSLQLKRFGPSGVFAPCFSPFFFHVKVY